MKTKIYVIYIRSKKIIYRKIKLLYQKMLFIINFLFNYKDPFFIILADNKISQEKFIKSFYVKNINRIKKSRVEKDLKIFRYFSALFAWKNIDIIKYNDEFNLKTSNTENLKNYLDYIFFIRKKTMIQGFLILIPAEKIFYYKENLAHSLKSIILKISAISRANKMIVPISFVITDASNINGFDEFSSVVLKTNENKNFVKDSSRNNNYKIENLNNIIFGLDLEMPNFNSKNKKISLIDESFNEWILDLQSQFLNKIALNANVDIKNFQFIGQLIKLKEEFFNNLLLTGNAQITGIYFTNFLDKNHDLDFLNYNFQEKYSAILKTDQKYSTHLDIVKYYPKSLIEYLILKYRKSPIFNHQILVRERNRSKKSFIIIFLFLICSLTFLSVSFWQNIKFSSEVEREINRLNDHLIKNNEIEFFLLMGVLNKINNYYNFSFKNTFHNLELYMPLKLRKFSYEKEKLIFKKFINPEFFKILEKILLSKNENIAWYYKSLKNYLMMGEKHKQNDLEYQAILNFYAHRFNDPSLRSIHLIIEQASKNSFSFNDIKKLNFDIVKKSRTFLKKFLVQNIIYQEFKLDHDDGKSMNFESAIPQLGKIFDLNEKKAQIPTFFNADSYYVLIDDKRKNINERIINAYKFLDLKESGSESFVFDQFKNLYFDDFLSVWQSALGKLHIVSFTSIEQAISILNFLTSESGPMHQLMNFITNNASLTSKPCNSLTYFKEHQCIQPIFDFTKRRDFDVALDALKNYFVMLKNSPQSQLLAFHDSSFILQQKAYKHPIVILKNKALNWSFPLNQWANEIADQSLKLLLQESSQYIQAAWLRDVWSYYFHHLHNRFPLSLQANTEVSFVNFLEFFQPNGILEHFFQTYLKPFTYFSSGNYQLLKQDEISLPISKNLLQLWQQSDEVKKIFFSNSNRQFGIQFAIRPRYLDAETAKVNIIISDQNLFYQHGPQYVQYFSWPSTFPLSEVQVNFIDFNGQSSSLSFSGIWSLFRLMQQSQFNMSNNSNQASWSIKSGEHQVIFDIWNTRNQEMFNPKLFAAMSLDSNTYTQSHI